MIVRCPSCMTRNRIPVARASDRPNCGKCGAKLPAIELGKVVNVTDQTFEAEVFSSPLPVLVDCWAPWCGPCRSIAPVLDELAVTYGTRLKIVKINMDENPQTSARFNVMSIPTMLLVQGKTVVDTLVGALPKEEIERQIARII
ncbi:MAG: thioredoxin TrxC [Desulfobacteraceae bacterium]|nr:MAG: thioredoxin TrxC [Desulfobacteraceae bacterium]